MAFLSSNLYSQITPARADDLFTTTLLDYRAEFIDQVFEDFVTWFWLREKGSMRTLDGGERIIEHLVKSTNATAAFYSLYESLNITPQTPFTAAAFEWKEAAVSIAIARKEERQNSGKHRILPLLQSRIDNARMAITDVIATAMYETSQATKKIESIDILVDATSNVGGIPRSSNSYWQSTVVASGSFASQGLSDMRTLYNTISSSAGKDSPDFIISTQSVYESYESVLQPQERFADAAMADGGFQSLRFKGAPFVYDSKIATGRLYMLNSKYLHLDIDSESDFVVSPFVKPTNQAARVAQILWMGNVTINNPRRCGKLTGVTA